MIISGRSELSSESLVSVKGANLKSRSGEICAGMSWKGELRPHLLGVDEQGGTVKGEWAGSAPFSPSVPKSFHRTNHWSPVLPRTRRCTCRETLARTSCFTSDLPVDHNAPITLPFAASTHSLINNHEEGSAEFSGSEEPVSFRHQYQSKRHGWVHCLQTIRSL